jgi:hypothetical protein
MQQDHILKRGKNSWIFTICHKITFLNEGKTVGFYNMPQDHIFKRGKNSWIFTICHKITFLNEGKTVEFLQYATRSHS